jgi:hypothetical protein
VNEKSLTNLSRRGEFWRTILEKTHNVLRNEVLEGLQNVVRIPQEKCEK